MKILKIFGLFLLSIVVAFFVFVLITGKLYVFKSLYYNFAGIDDYKIFDNRTINKSPNPQPWPLAKSYNKVPLPATLDKALEDYKTVAFVVIKNDSLVFEKYWDGYGPASYSNSFSMAKSIVSVLIGCAIKEGKIRSEDQFVADFLPEFKKVGLDTIKIKHLLMMSSGLNWDESYVNPLSMTTEAYYGSDLRSLIGRLKPKDTPGKYFNYLSGDTQVLSFILKEATGKKLSDYASEKLWRPLGAENDALWCIDKPDGDEKAYCCVNSNAKDFARIGQLYLNQGHWKGEQIVDSSWVKKSTSIAPIADKSTNEPITFYGYQWWIRNQYKGQDIFYMRGILGQYVIVIPEKRIVICRLGHKRSLEKDGENIKDTFEYIDGVNKVF